MKTLWSKLMKSAPTTIAACIVFFLCCFINGCGKRVRHYTLLVSGEGVGTAVVAYTAAGGDTRREKVSLPWEKSFEYESAFSNEISVINEQPQGSVACAITVDGIEQTHRTSGGYARCAGSRSEVGNVRTSKYTGTTTEIQLEKVQELLSRDALPDALDSVEQAARAAPHFSEAHFLKGFVLSRMGEREPAIAAFTKALECDPENMDALNNRAVLLESKDLPAEAP